MGLPPSLGPVPAVCWTRLQACSWSPCPGRAPRVDEAFCLLSLPSQAPCGLLWVAQLPGCVLAGPGLSCLPSAWPASGTGPGGRVRGLSPTQHLCRAFLCTKCFAFPFIGSLSDQWCKRRSHYRDSNAKGVTEAGKSGAPHKQVQIKMDTLQTPIILVYIWLQFLKHNRGILHVGICPIFCSSGSSWESSTWKKR